MVLSSPSVTSFRRPPPCPDGARGVAGCRLRIEHGVEVVLGRISNLRDDEEQLGGGRHVHAAGRSPLGPTGATTLEVCSGEIHMEISTGTHIRLLVWTLPLSAGIQTCVLHVLHMYRHYGCTKAGQQSLQT